jgi:glycosyltransferase involved in cell wall biosynthesis
MKTITVFTPTYNRGYCLHQCYDSLKRQSCDDFKWLIIDDGSTDNTKELVDTWVNENQVEIEYHFKKNGGMHTGHNTAYALIDTELNVCIDSDDYLTDFAIERILTFWSKNKDDRFAGIVGLDRTVEGEILGKKFPKHLHSSTLENLYYRHEIPGDKKLVYRTAVVKKYPEYPVFKGESFVPLGSLYLQIDKEYELLCLNEALCVVEYMEDGSTMSIFKQYRKHPKGFRYSRDIELKHSNYWFVKLKAIVHRVSCNMLVKDYRFFKDNEHKLMTLVMLPVGILLSYYVNYKNRDH